MVADACNPSYLGGWGRRIIWTWEVEVTVAEITPLHSSWGNMSETLFQKKKKKIHILRLGTHAFFFLENALFNGDAVDYLQMESLFWIIWVTPSFIIKVLVSERERQEGQGENDAAWETPLAIACCEHVWQDKITTNLVIDVIGFYLWFMIWGNSPSTDTVMTPPGQCNNKTVGFV